MPRIKRRLALSTLIVCAVAAATTACATLQQIAALRRVDFTIDRVAQARLAGVAIDSVRSYRDLSALDLANIGVALSRGELPFNFNLHLSALNPAENGVTARLVQLDWTLLLDDRDVLDGATAREYLLEPGVAADIPIAISVDLADFFQRNAQDMIDLALAVAGAGGGAEPKRIALRATPTIQTALGPIRYPQPITIVSRTVGGQGGR